MRQNVSFLVGRKYHLLANPVAIQTGPSILRRGIREISVICGLSLFLSFLFYQLLGHSVLIVLLVCGTLCKNPFCSRATNEIRDACRLASLYGLQDALLFQPNEPDTSRLIVQTPDLFQMPYEKITIDTPDEEKLHGYLIKQIHRSDERPTLLFFHGNAGNIGHR